MMTLRRATRPIVVAILAVATWGTASVEAPTRASAAVADDTLQSIANCLHERHALSIVMLVDTSGSLQTTDPANDRISAARLAITNFASLAAIEDGGEKPKIELLLAGFSSRFDVIVPWTALTPKSRSGFDAPLDSFATRNEGIDTDFPTALLGAQRELEARAKRGCRAVLLFTDGKYDVVDGSSQARVDAGLTKEYAPGISLDRSGSSDEVERLGRDFLCRPDGLADQLRSGKMTLVTVALSVRIDPIDQQFLRALSEQSAGGQTCGSRKRGAGAYLAAAQLSELKQQFNRVTTAIAGGRAVDDASQAVEVCDRQACDAGRIVVPVDPAAGRVSLLVDTATAGVDANVTLPDGTEIVVPAGESGEQTVDGSTIRWTWVDDRTVNIEADVAEAGEAPDQEPESIAVTLVQSEGRTGEVVTARVDTYLYNGWAPALFVDAFLLEGVAQTIRLEVVDADGESVNVVNYRGEVTLRATLTVGEGDAEPITIEGPDVDGVFSFAYEAPRDTGGTSATLAIDLAVTTAQGLALAPVSRTAELDVRLPDVYPTVSNATVDFGSVRSTGTAEAVIDVSGGRDRPGCVWVSDVVFDVVPDGAEGIDWAASNTTEAECEQVLANADETIELALTPRHAADGDVRGTVMLSYHAGAGTETRLAEVPFELRQLPPIDQGQRLGLFFGILVVGLAAPLGALQLMNRSLARFAATPTMHVARIPIAARQRFRQLMTLGIYEDVESASDLRSVARVESDGSLAPLFLEQRDFRPWTGSGTRSRHVQFEELHFRARTERNPFAPPFASVESDRPVAAGPRPGTDSTVTAEIPLALAGSWFIVLGETDRNDLPDGWVGAEVVVFVAGADLAGELVEASRSLDEQGGRLVNALRNLHAGISTADPVSAR